MKKFNYPQKKWVMATALLAVLAVNVSFNPHKKEVGAADFALTAAPEESNSVDAEDADPEFMEMLDKLSTSGRKKVKLTSVKTKSVKLPIGVYKGDDNELLAVLPGKTVQGSFCTTCGYSVVSLNNEDDIEVLKEQIEKTAKKSKTKVTKEPEEESEEVVEEEIAVKTKEKDEDEEVAEEEEEEKSAFDGIQERCEKKSSEEEVLGCFKDKFVKALKAKKFKAVKMKNGTWKYKEIRPEEALRFYKSEIEVRLLKQVADARRVSTRSKLSSLSQSSFISYTATSDFDKDPDMMITGVGDIISELISEVPSKFESVRTSLIKAETDILKYQTALYKEQSNIALTTKNPTEYNEAMVARNSLANGLNQMQNEFYYRNENSLSQALINKNIDEELHNRYTKALLASNSEIYNYLIGKNTTLNGLTLPNNAYLNERIALSGQIRGTLGAYPLNPAVSSRTGGNLAISGQTNLSTLAVQTTPNGTIVIPTQDTGIYPQNIGIGFGQPTPITNRYLQMRRDYRSNLYPRQ